MCEMKVFIIEQAIASLLFVSLQSLCYSHDDQYGLLGRKYDPFSNILFEYFTFQKVFFAQIVDFGICS